MSVTETTGTRWRRLAVKLCLRRQQQTTIFSSFFFCGSGGSSPSIPTISHESSNPTRKQTERCQRDPPSLFAWQVSETMVSHESFAVPKRRLHEREEREGLGSISKSIAANWNIYSTKPRNRQKALPLATVSICLPRCFYLVRSGRGMKRVEERGS